MLLVFIEWPLQSAAARVDIPFLWGRLSGRIAAPKRHPRTPTRPVVVLNSRPRASVVHARHHRLRMSHQQPGMKFDI